jgi:Uma2 family endonuclease
MDVAEQRDLVEKLHRVEGKAEIINGEIVHLMATGDRPSEAAFEIAVRLRSYQRQQDARKGRAYADNTGFLVDLPNRQSFSPDASFYVGERAGMSFLEGTPVFAVEVRSENDYGEAAERAMAEKRADYFAAGTETIWDVDLQSETDTVRVFRGGEAETPDATYGRTGTAEAEPALPGFEMPVDALFSN